MHLTFLQLLAEMKLRFGADADKEIRQGLCRIGERVIDKVSAIKKT
jgi:hypothetical protein